MVHAPEGGEGVLSVPEVAVQDGGQVPAFDSTEGRQVPVVDDEDGKQAIEVAANESDGAVTMVMRNTGDEGYD